MAEVKGHHSVPVERLDRIEAKLDKLSDTVVAIARTEEQITSIFALHKAVEEKVSSHANEISKLRERAHDLANRAVIVEDIKFRLERQEEIVGDMRMDTHDNSKSLAKIEKLSWTLLSAVLGVVVYLIQRALT